jgi:SAM-dependent methyltransferase
MKIATTIGSGAVGRRIALRRPPWQSARTWLSRCKRRVKWGWKFLRIPHRGFLRFRCNICGTKTSFPREQLSRELWSCFYCGSNVRWRSVIHALSTELFGTSLPIPDFPNRPHLAGIGLSDWEGYATRLAEKFDYTNTYYHKEPFLDITSADASHYGRYDFIIASDVFEHISPPISRAFENARRLLKPDGIMIFTVPYIEGETKEHFPDLHQFSVHKKGDTWILLNETSDGRKQEFTNVTFHGGPGTVVEMRLFGKEALRRNIQEAGFASVRLYDAEYLQDGIRWVPYLAEDAPYHPLIYGLDTPPWTLRNFPEPRASGRSD